MNDLDHSIVGGITYMAGKKAAPRTICLSGEQSVRTIAQAHAALFAAVSETNGVVLDISKVEDADLTLVQLIESARLTAASLGKNFCLKAPLPAVLTEQLDRAGFLAAPVSHWKSIAP